MLSFIVHGLMFSISTDSISYILLVGIITLVSIGIVVYRGDKHGN